MMKFGARLFVLVLAGLVAGCNFQGPSGGGTSGEGLTGIIVDRQGSPVAGATVRLYPEGFDADGETRAGEARPDSLVTDVGGRFAFDGVEAGRYNLEASLTRGDTVLTLLAPGLEITRAEDLGEQALDLSATLLVHVTIRRSAFLEGARCFIPGTSYSARSDSTGACRLAVAAGTYRVSAFLPGMRRGVSESVSVAAGGVNNDAAITLYPAESPIPTVTGSIRYFGKNTFTDSTEEGAVFLVIAYGGQARCEEDSLIVWDEEEPGRFAEITSMGLGEDFDGLEDLAAGLYENRPASSSLDGFHDVRRFVDLRVDAVTGAEVSGHYTLRDAAGNAILPRQEFRAVKCPDP